MTEREISSLPKPLRALGVPRSSPGYHPPLKCNSWMFLKCSKLPQRGSRFSLWEGSWDPSKLCRLPNKKANKLTESAHVTMTHRRVPPCKTADPERSRSSPAGSGPNP